MKDDIEQVIQRSELMKMTIANEKRKASIKSTRQKRNTQECKVFKLKLAKSNINRNSQDRLKRMFLEAKWLYNHSLEKGAFDVSRSLKEVQVKVKNEFQTRSLTTLGAHMKQDVVDGLRQNIKNLNKSRRKGIKVGALNFISNYDSINLRSHGNTYTIKGNKIHIQNIPKWLRVLGTRQLKGYELANAKLIQRVGSYYIHVTCYKTKDEIRMSREVIGTDQGLEHQLSISGGDCGLLIDYQYKFPKRLRILYRQLSRKERHSSNWYKHLVKLKREFIRWTSCKHDSQNKISHILLENFRVIYQDDNLRGWQRLWGRKMLSTGIGGIIARFKKSATTIQVNRYHPTTKECPRCGHMKDLTLGERTYVCNKCGYTAQRDFKSATVTRKIGLKEIGMDGAESTPVEMKPLLQVMERLNAVPKLRASFVAETGSPHALAVGGGA